jgi:voltage-gated potassium channel
MKFVLDFVKMYLQGLGFLWPIILAVLVIICGLGLYIGRLERWTPTNALYFSFITATSVGYGDFHPTRRRSKWLAILIALTGVLLTGLIVATGLEAVAHAFREARGGSAPIAP